MRCKECGTAKHKRLHEDPREAPLDFGEILCTDCTVMAIDDMIADHEDAVLDLKKQREGLE